MKTKFIFIAILMLLLLNTAHSQIIDEPYDFPIKPGTPEWAALSVEDRLKALQIPDDILKRLSTRALVETCLNYPMFRDYRASSSTPLVGIRYVMGSFNGFGELMQRQDAFTYLSEKSLSFDPLAINEEWGLAEKGNYTFELIKIEILLFQDEIIEKAIYEEKILLLEDSYSKFKKMQDYGSPYDINNYETIFYLMTKLLLAIDDSEITAEIENNQNIALFLNTMRGSSFFEEIEILVKRMLDAKGAIGINEVKDIPDTYTLSQNYPNPFNPTTKIEYFIPEASRVRLSMYNTLGQEVVKLVDKYQSIGKYSVDFNATNLPSGIYFYRLQSDKFNAVKKMMLLK